MKASNGTERPPSSVTVRRLVAAAKELADASDALRFASPVDCVYNPLTYAWPAHQLYLEKFGRGRKRTVFLGMNPGPFGMAQTGVPFGEVTAVRNWLGIHVPVGKPTCEHPKRLITGFDCPRSEVSGKRLWDLFASRFGSAMDFFSEHFVVNYCPLSFMEMTGRNLTPDKLRPEDRNRLYAVCDEHLRKVLGTLQPEWLIGIGEFARKRAETALSVREFRIGSILHPSPASPAANRNWAQTVTEQLRTLGVWAD